MNPAVAVALAMLGVLVAETLEGLRLFTVGEDGTPNTWPRDLPFDRYVTVGAIRIALGGLVALALVALGVMCDESLAFLSGLSTLKVVEVLFGYSRTD